MMNIMQVFFICFVTAAFVLFGKVLHFLPALQSTG